MAPSGSPKRGRKGGGPPREPRKNRDALASWPILASRPHAVKALGLSLRTFERLEADGVIRAHEAGRGGRQSTYDLGACFPAYVRYLEREQEETPKDRRDRSQAELNELRLARERAELLPRDQVVREGQMFAKAVTAKLRAVPPRLVRAGIIPSNAQAAAAELIREGLEEISRWSNELDLRRAIDDPDGKWKQEQDPSSDPPPSGSGRKRTRRRRG